MTIVGVMTGEVFITLVAVVFVGVAIIVVVVVTVLRSIGTVTERKSVVEISSLGRNTLNSVGEISELLNNSVII